MKITINRKQYYFYSDNFYKYYEIKKQKKSDVKQTGLNKRQSKGKKKMTKYITLLELKDKEIIKLKSQIIDLKIQKENYEKETIMQQEEIRILNNKNEKLRTNLDILHIVNNTNKNTLESISKILNIETFDDVKILRLKNLLLLK